MVVNAAPSPDREGPERFNASTSSQLRMLRSRPAARQPRGAHLHFRMHLLRRLRRLAVRRPLSQLRRRSGSPADPPGGRPGPLAGFRRTRRRISRRMRLTTVGVDADDTLWHNETVFRLTQDRLADLLSPYADPADLHAHLAEVELRNLSFYGYGVKAFTLSMIETTLAFAGDAAAGVIREILAA